MSIAVVGNGITDGVAERRKSPRYRYSAPISVRLPNLEPVRGMTVEISESGMSAMISAVLEVGTRVELESVGGAAAQAVVRRSAGRLCGFEFLGLNPDQVRNIRDKCTMLPVYYSKTLDLWQQPTPQ